MSTNDQIKSDPFLMSTNHQIKSDPFLMSTNHQVKSDPFLMSINHQIKCDPFLMLKFFVSLITSVFPISLKENILFPSKRLRRLQC